MPRRRATAQFHSRRHISGHHRQRSARTVLVFVPLEADVTAMRATFTVNEGTTVTPPPARRARLHLPRNLYGRQPYGDEEILYRHRNKGRDVAGSESPSWAMPAASTPSATKPKQPAAGCFDNVPNSRYISLQQIIDGEAHLDDYTMLWCHFDWLDWPSRMWDTRDIFSSYWLHGGAILASRDGARYINDVWRIAATNKAPTICSAARRPNAENPDGLHRNGPWGPRPLCRPDTRRRRPHTAAQHGLLVDRPHPAMGRRLGPTGSMAGWESRTGAKALASGHDYDINRVTIAEFEPWEALAGFTSGRVITIGTPASRVVRPQRCRQSLPRESRDTYQKRHQLPLQITV